MSHDNLAQPENNGRQSAAEPFDAHTRELFSLAQSTDSPEERQRLLDDVIVLHLGLAHAEASRYRSRGIPLDDLRQVAALALTKATRGFDVTAGHDFLSYAVPTIRGELRKYFRDHGWMIRPPRRIQELQARINAAETELSNRLGRSPQPVEIADHIEECTESVIEALASDGCFVPASLDHPAGEDGSTLGDLLPLRRRAAPGLRGSTGAQPGLRRLGERDRQILAMRFYEGLTQREIAERIGVTQMQVSRLLTRILGQLRSGVGEVPLGEDGPLEGGRGQHLRWSSCRRSAPSPSCPHSSTPSCWRPRPRGVSSWEHAGEVQVAEIDPELADTAAMTEAYDVPLDASANCVVVMGRRAGEERTAACVVRADTRADVNNVVRRALDVRKASFLDHDRAVEETGMEYGGITPIGIPAGGASSSTRSSPDRPRDHRQRDPGSKLFLPGLLPAPRRRGRCRPRPLDHFAFPFTKLSPRRSNLEMP